MSSGAVIARFTEDDRLDVRDLQRSVATQIVAGGR